MTLTDRRNGAATHTTPFFPLSKKLMTSTLISYFKQLIRLRLTLQFETPFTLFNKIAPQFVNLSENSPSLQYRENRIL